MCFVTISISEVFSFFASINNSDFVYMLFTDSEHRIPRQNQLSFGSMIIQPEEKLLSTRTRVDRNQETFIIHYTFNIGHGQVILGIVMYM